MRWSFDATRTAWKLIWLVVALLTLGAVIAEGLPFVAAARWQPPPVSDHDIESWPEYSVVRKSLESKLQKLQQRYPPGGKAVSMTLEGSHKLSLLVSYGFTVTASRLQGESTIQFTATAGQPQLHPGRALGFFLVAVGLLGIPILFRGGDLGENHFLLRREQMLSGDLAGSLPAAILFEAQEETRRVRRLETLARRLSYSGLMTIFLGGCAAWGLLPFWLPTSEPFDFSLLTRPFAVFFAFSAFAAFLLRQARSTMEDVKYFGILRAKNVNRLASLAEMPTGEKWRNSEKVVEALLADGSNASKEDEDPGGDGTALSLLLQNLQGLGSGKT